MEAKLTLHGEILGVRYFLKSSIHRQNNYSDFSNFFGVIGFNFLLL
jgi:uncharacterized membrane protein YjfL (UPF0719 family)